MALLEAKNIWKVYNEGEESETVALSDVSFGIKEGEFASIMGPSGCGKSTLLHILGLLDHPTKGNLFLDEKAVLNYSDEELAFLRNRKIGFVFQSFHLLPRISVLENVKVPLIYSDAKESLWEERALQAIESVGMQHRLSHEPSQLSGGEKQRVAIARALVNFPKIIFADEPTGNLDSKSGKTVMEILQSLNEKEGKTIILVTHETYTAEHSERIIKMMDGKIESDEKVLNRRKASVSYSK
jgi:putative ABC transport system ATP-binding protein